MDPLTIFGAVTGGISAASEIIKALEWVISIVSKVREAPEMATATLSDVSMMRRNMLQFQQLLESVTASQERLSYIRLEDTKNTFMDCVSSLDELENIIKPLVDPSLDPLALSVRLQWAMKDKRIEELSERVHNTQNSLGLMLIILQKYAITVHTLLYL
jgi:hypothetical protein